MSEEKELDQLLKDFDDSGQAGVPGAPAQPGAEQAGAIEHILTPEALVHSISSLTKMLGRKLDFPELELTADDELDLINALKPFEDKLDLLIKYLPYLPLGMFAVGYSIRVASGLKRKKQEKQAKENGNGREPPTKEQAEEHAKEAKKSADTDAAANDKGEGSREPSAN